MLRLVVCLFALACALPVATASAASRLPSARATAHVVGKLTESGRVHGLVVGYVSPAGRAVYGFGRVGEDKRSKAPDGHTLFEIGSITKTFTGQMLAQAVMEGRLRATDPIRLYLPQALITKDSPLYWVSLLDLATHTSGLPEAPSNLPSKDPRNPLAGYSTALLLDYLKTAKTISPVGRDFYYSNTAAGLTGLILANLWDTDYETLVKTRLCAPLHMPDTTISLSPDQAARMTHGHDEGGNVVPNWEVTGLEGAGAFRSSAEDLLTYGAANMGILPSPLLPAMKLAQLPRKHVSSIPTLYIGLFWNIMNFNGKEFVLHAGRSGGYFALVLLSPEDGTGVVLLSDTEGDFTDQAWKLLSLATGKHLP
jgi:CubicO group peptidase (beta-lactamase class C family)